MINTAFGQQVTRQLTESAIKWANKYLDVYRAGERDYDLAVLLMATAVEHMAKARLSGFTPVLVLDQPIAKDGNLKQARAILGLNKHGSAEVHSANFDVILARVKNLCDIDLTQTARGLREARNGISHLAMEQTREARALLRQGIDCLEQLYTPTPSAPLWKGKQRNDLRDQIVSEAVGDARLAYDNKIERYRREFDRRMTLLSREDRQRIQAERERQIPLLPKSDYQRATCPACRSKGIAYGSAVYTGDGWDWWGTSRFECRLCGLNLGAGSQGPEELRFADLAGWELQLFEEAGPAEFHDESAPSDED